MDEKRNLDERLLPWPRIVAKAVHDMRTPLSSMRVTLEILRMAPADPEKQQMLIEMLNRQTDELSLHLQNLSEDPELFLPQPAAGTP